MNSSFKKIIITGDTRRPLSPQKTNILKLAWLVERGLELEHRTVPQTLEDQIYKCESPEQWAEEYSFDPSHYHITKMDLEDALVIGFELPDSVKKFFCRHDVSYLDYRMSPIRYLPDLQFALQTNWIPRGTTDLYVAHLEAETIKNRYWKNRTKSQFSQPVTVLLGQCPYDASLIHEGKFLKLDYRSEPDELIVFKPHPLHKNFTIKTEMPGKIPITEMPIYDLLADPGVQKIVSISSSASFEAQQFGIQSTTLHPNPWWRNYDNLTLPLYRLLTIRGDSLLRHYYGTWWGYPRDTRTKNEPTKEV